MLCSRAGIARHPNVEVYITESCIGCGICAERCPYGAISIVNIEDEPLAHEDTHQEPEHTTHECVRRKCRTAVFGNDAPALRLCEAP